MIRLCTVPKIWCTTDRWTDEQKDGQSQKVTYKRWVPHLKIQQVLHLWNSHMLTLEGRIIIFKTIAISKIAYLDLMTNVPKVIVEELQ